MYSLKVRPKNFFDFSALFTYIIPDLVWEMTVSCFCHVCELCSLAFHSPGPQTFSMQNHGLIFWTNPSWVAGKYIFCDVVCRFCLILAFFEQKVQKIWRRNGPIKKINAKFGLANTQNIFGTWKHCTHKALVMWLESFELVFLGSLFHWFHAHVMLFSDSLPTHPRLMWNVEQSIIKSEKSNFHWLKLTIKFSEGIAYVSDMFELFTLRSLCILQKF